MASWTACGLVANIVGTVLVGFVVPRHRTPDCRRRLGAVSARWERGGRSDGRSSLRGMRPETTQRKGDKMTTSAPVVPWGLLLLVLNTPARVVAQSGWVLDSSIERRGGTVTWQAIAKSLEPMGAGSSSLMTVSCDDHVLEVGWISLGGALFQFDKWQPDMENDALLFVRRNTGPAVAETWPLYSPFSAQLKGRAAIALARDLVGDTVFIVRNSPSDGEAATFRIGN
jgi:hypothetical protein